MADPLDVKARLDEDALAVLVPVAVRMLDNVTDASRLPLLAQRSEAHAERRIGLGVTGLADPLIMCGARYGSDRTVELTERWMGAIRYHAYHASAALAAEKGDFPLYKVDAFLASATIYSLPEDTRDVIRAYGIQNALLTSVAPTGTISLFADNVSSGIEPVFSYYYTRSVLMPDGTRREEEVLDYANCLCRRVNGYAPLLEYFVTAQDIAPGDHVVMQAAAQNFLIRRFPKPSMFQPMLRSIRSKTFIDRHVIPALEDARTAGPTT